MHCCVPTGCAILHRAISHKPKAVTNTQKLTDLVRADNLELTEMEGKTEKTFAPNVDADKIKTAAALVPWVYNCGFQHFVLNHLHCNFCFLHDDSWCID
jgi:hypothetical protein